MTQRREIKNRKPPMTESHAMLSIHPAARIIRPTMDDGVSHGTDLRSQNFTRLIASCAKKSCYATHAFSSNCPMPCLPYFK